jgi:hypothetical protein
MGLTSFSITLILASSLLGWYVLPPEEFSDRLHVIPSSNVTIDISLYDDPKYSKAWFDEDGWASILHKMNPTRVAYFDKVFTKTLKDKKSFFARDRMWRWLAHNSASTERL